MSIPTITVKELHDRMKAGENISLIDVRTPAEYRKSTSHWRRILRWSHLMSVRSWLSTKAQVRCM